MSAPRNSLSLDVTWWHLAIAIQGGSPGEWGADVLTRESTLPDAMAQLATVVDRAPAVPGSLHTESTSLPPHHVNPIKMAYARPCCTHMSGLRWAP